MGKETHKIFSFLDVRIDNNYPSGLKTTTYLKKFLLNCSEAFSALFPSLTKLGSSVLWCTEYTK